MKDKAAAKAARPFVPTFHFSRLWKTLDVSRRNLGLPPEVRGTREKAEATELLCTHGIARALQGIELMEAKCRREEWFRKGGFSIGRLLKFVKGLPPSSTSTTVVPIRRRPTEAELREYAELAARFAKPNGQMRSDA